MKFFFRTLTAYAFAIKASTASHVDGTLRNTFFAFTSTLRLPDYIANNTVCINRSKASLICVPQIHLLPLP